MENKLREMQDRAVQFFNSLPDKVELRDLMDAALFLEDPAFITKETIDKKFNTTPESLALDIHEAQMYSKVIRIIAFNELTTECLGVMFASTQADYKQGLLEVEKFVQECLSEFSLIKTDTGEYYQLKYCKSLAQLVIKDKVNCYLSPVNCFNRDIVN